MRKVFSELDYLTTEIGTVLNLCEWIDRQENAELSEALPTLHVVMHENFNLLVDRFHVLRAEAPAGTCARLADPSICENCRRQCH